MHFRTLLLEIDVHVFLNMQKQLPRLSKKKTQKKFINHYRRTQHRGDWIPQYCVNFDEIAYFKCSRKKENQVIENFCEQAQNDV